MKFSKTIELSVFGVIALAFLGIFFTPYDPHEQAFREIAFAGSSGQHWFGIDGLGRDFGSRLWRGSGNTVAMACAAMLLNLALSSLLLSVEQGGPSWASRIVRLTIGLWVAVPVILISLVLLVFLKPSPGSLVLAAALGTVPFSFRQMRIHWLEQRNALYVQASKVLGADRRHLLTYALWPNLKPDLVGLLKLVFAICVLDLSGLAFLGLIGDPDFPELGAILRQNQAYLFRSPALVIWPGLILSALLLLVHSSSSTTASKSSR